MGSFIYNGFAAKLRRDGVLLNSLFTDRQKSVLEDIMDWETTDDYKSMLSLIDTDKKDAYAHTVRHILHNGYFHHATTRRPSSIVYDQIKKISDFSIEHLNYLSDLYLTLGTLVNRVEEHLTSNHAMTRKREMIWANMVRDLYQNPNTSNRYDYYTIDPSDLCKVCQNEPGTDGWFEHGKGCYMLTEEGGGEDYISCNSFSWASERMQTAAREIYNDNRFEESGILADMIEHDLTDTQIRTNGLDYIIEHLKKGLCGKFCWVYAGILRRDFSANLLQCEGI